MICDDNHVRILAKAVLVIVRRNIRNRSAKMLQEICIVVATCGEVAKHIALLQHSVFVSHEFSHQKLWLSGSTESIGKKGEEIMKSRSSIFGGVNIALCLRLTKNAITMCKINYFAGSNYALQIKSRWDELM